MRDKMIKNLLLIMLGLFCIACATSQTKVILGAVMDNNNKPIGGAIVSTDPPTSTVATDNLGRYTLRLDKEGTYSVRADILGYLSEPVTVEVKGDDLTWADIKILPESMAPVVEPLPVVKETTSTNETSTDSATEGQTDKKWWEKQ